VSTVSPHDGHPHLDGVVDAARAAGGESLAARVRFLVELDALKRVHRRSLLVDASRPENSAEHSWHLALFALLLAPHAAEDVDVTRVVEMLLVHDVVEIDAGDVLVYDTAAMADKARAEAAAADRIFGLLPDAEADRLRALWEEYEERATPEARFAFAVDRLQPVLLNALSGGRTWRDHDVHLGRVVEVNAPIGDAAPELWAFARAVLDGAVGDGRLAAAPAPSPG